MSLSHTSSGSSAPELSKQCFFRRGGLFFAGRSFQRLIAIFGLLEIKTVVGILSKSDSATAFDRDR